MSEKHNKYQRIDLIIDTINQIRTTVEKAVEPKKIKIGALSGIDIYCDNSLKDGEWVIMMNTDTFEKIVKS